MPNTILLEVFTDYVCPWCYLGDNRTKKLKQDYDILVQLVHFPLHPETPIEGRTLQELFGCGPEQIKAKNMQMKNLMSAEGLAYNDRSHTYNSRIAQEIGIWADTQMGADTIHEKFYQAYFIDGRNIGEIEVIIDVVKSIGLDAEEARTVIAERRYKDAVDSDWAKSHSYGVTGVPTYVSNGQGVTGAQPYNVLQNLMHDVGAQKRSR